MAIVENPIIGRARGSVGNCVFTFLFGKNILKSKPISINDPKTPAQLAHRARYKKLVKLLRQVINQINIANVGLELGTFAYTHLMSLNSKRCFIVNSDSIDPSLFVLCDNVGSFVDNVVLTSTVANTITGTFDSNAQNADEDADPVKAYGFDVDGNKIWQFCDSAIRGTGKITLTKLETSGLTIAVYFECLDRVNPLMDKPRHVIKYVGSVKVFE
jgi:hypothetical protein